MNFSKQKNESRGRGWESAQQLSTSQPSMHKASGSNPRTEKKREGKGGRERRRGRGDDARERLGSVCLCE